MAKLFNFFKKEEDKEQEQIFNVTDDYAVRVKTVYDKLNSSKQESVKEPTEEINKSYNGKNINSYSEPLLIGNIDSGMGYKTKGATDTRNVHLILKQYSGNLILNSIINTRANQVSMFARPSRYSEKGQGFQVRLKDISAVPTKRQEKRMREIEEFLTNTGDSYDPSRDSFVTFLKKIVRDTYTYDQVNFEKVYDSKKGELKFFELVDPTTIFIGTDKNGNKPKRGTMYVQVIDSQIVTRYDEKEMAFAVRNPRSDIYSAGYGWSELEIGLPLFNAYSSTLKFNDMFFSHGGTTRGLLNIKPMGQQSQVSLEAFRREWQNSVSGANASWKIPVITAEDAKFVNMTPSANDMQFEKWTNMLINTITSLFQIDPTEINFPNNSGASGSSGSISSGTTSRKTQDSQKKGLLPLLLFIEDVINNNIINELGEEFTFQFVGGDIAEQLEKINVITEKTKVAQTINEARRELGLTGDIIGGDIPANGVIVQRRGQIYQQEQFQYKKQQERLAFLMENTKTPITYENPNKPNGDKPTYSSRGSTRTGEDTSDANNFQEQQRGLDGSSSKVNGSGTTGDVGKDGQIKGEDNANSYATSLDPNNND